MDNSEKYPEIAKKLKNLEQIKAGDDFVNKLHSKIVEYESEKRYEHTKKFDEERGGFLRNLFGNRQYPWLIPAVGFTAIFFVFYITYLSQNASENKNELPSANTQTEQKIQTSENHASESEQKTTLNSENAAIEEEKSTQKDIAGNLKSDEDLNQSRKRNDNMQSPDNDEDNITSEQSNQTQTDRMNIKEYSNPSSPKENNDGEKTETYSEGKTSMVPTTIHSTSDRGAEDIPKAIAVIERDQLNNRLDKLNTINKSNLENLRKKVSDK